MPDEAGCDPRHEQYGRAPRAQFARPQARERAACALAADRLATLQIAPIARTRVPIIALHVFARTCEHHTAERVRGRRIAADETMSIPIYVQPAVRRDRCALGVVD